MANIRIGARNITTAARGYRQVISSLVAPPGDRIRPEAVPDQFRKLTVRLLRLARRARLMLKPKPGFSPSLVSRLNEFRSHATASAIRSPSARTTSSGSCSGPSCRSRCRRRSVLRPSDASARRAPAPEIEVGFKSGTRPLEIPFYSGPRRHDREVTAGRRHSPGPGRILDPQPTFIRMQRFQDLDGEGIERYQPSCRSGPRVNVPPTAVVRSDGVWRCNSPVDNQWSAGVRVPVMRYWRFRSAVPLVAGPTAIRNRFSLGQRVRHQPGEGDRHRHVAAIVRWLW